MDWMYDVDRPDEGLPIFYEIVDNEFRPVVVFSAVDLRAMFEDVQKKYPLVRYIQKGDDDSIVMVEIDKWWQYAKIISDMRSSLNKALIEASKAIENLIGMQEVPSEPIVKYMLSKRAMQFFDGAEVGDTPPAWIQYEYPPIPNHLLVGDILRKRNDSDDYSICGQPNDYLIVLTPTCDMARPEDEQRIIVSQGRLKTEFYPECTLVGQETIISEKGKKKVDKIKSCLTQGNRNGKLPIPELPNKIPDMCFDLKKTSHIPIDEIAIFSDSINRDKHKYIRVASIISPFREQIVWAYMISSCRPGVPERDYTRWAEGFVQV